MTTNLSRLIRDDMPASDGRRDVMDRMHAPFAITRALDVLGLSAWTHTLLGWLGNYDGFERQLPSRLDPLLAVRDILAGYVMSSAPVKTGSIVVDICALEVLHRRAAWVNQAKRRTRTWMPLHEPWFDFVTQGEADEDLRVWWSSQPWPSEDLLRRYLLSGYLRMDSLRRP
ncbi:MAG TPA: hypothetical protein VFP68_20270 [Burkholderiaceae bacterium]|nr:hypothetical protein [Burkholderiaceae bacterium]